MGYTVHLFGLDGKDFAERLVNDGKEILDQTRARVQKERRVSKGDLERGMEIAQAICNGELPKECDDDYFWVLCWIGDTVLERIPSSGLAGVNHFDYIEEVGVWPLLGRWKPPFPVPRSSEVPPAVGYLPREAMAETAIPELEQLPEPGPDAANARRTLIEVIESLDEDELDLLTVITRL